MTRRLPALALFLSAAAMAGPALAQSVSSPSTTVRGITVAPPAKVGPKVVSTFPEAGKSVQPGAIILKVTFDQKMSPDGWDYGKGQDRYPNCLARPRLLSDEKTFILLCTAGPNTHFSVQFNSTDQGGFINLAGQRATPSGTDFTTLDGASLSTIADAMKAAGLKADEGPVMDEKAAASAPPAAPPKPATPPAP